MHLGSIKLNRTFHFQFYQRCVDTEKFDKMLILFKIDKTTNHFPENIQNFGTTLMMVLITW